MNEEQIKGKIIQLLNRELVKFKDPEKTVLELVGFLTGLTVTKIKTAVLNSLEEDRAALMAEHDLATAAYDDAIAGIGSL